MKRTCILLCLLIVFSITQKASATEASSDPFTFKHFRFKPDIFNQQLKKLKSKKGTKPPVDEHRSPLFDEIAEYLNNNYQSIGNTETASILKFNREFNMGSQNYSGFNWQKPMGKFSIQANRHIEQAFGPNEPWIVRDTLIINIDATSFLKSAEADGVIEITKTQLGLFAGMTFRRQYTYEHLAETYEKGLLSDFSKLFLTFNIFDTKRVFALEEYEIVTKEDQISAVAGGMVETPSYYGLSANVGALVKFSHIGSVKVQKLGPEDAPHSGELIRVHSLKSKIVTTGITAELQIDLMKLVKITLFSYDFEYALEKSQDVGLSFGEQDYDKLTGDGDEALEFKQILSLTIPDIKALKPNIVSLEQREKEAKSSKFAALLFGTMKKKNTEMIKIIKDNKTKIFFNSYFENIKLVQNLFSRLLNITIMAAFKFEKGVKSDAVKSRSVEIAYEASENSTQHEDVFVASEEKMSFQLIKEYQVKDTTGWTKKMYKDHAIEIMQNYTSLGADFVTMVRKDELRGPLTINTHVMVGKDGLRFFNALDVDQTFLNLAIICGSKKPSVWIIPAKREEAMKHILVGEEKCVKDLGESYLTYRQDWDRYHEMNFKKFRDFLIGVHKETDHRDDLTKFFGPNNIFFNGSFQAKTKTGNFFQTYFKDGVFKSAGIIDDYVRGAGQGRTPASIE